LDIDYKWIKYAVKKGVFISINPDAHNKEGIHDIRYGVLAARKGGLSKEDCLNTRDLSQFKGWLEA
jgi:DNA polymerase (family 10)